MRYDSDESYEKYKQFRLNKYRYESEQREFPLVVIVIISIIFSVLSAIWKWRGYILFTSITIAVLSFVTFLILKKCRSKEMIADQCILLSSAEAESGMEIEAHIRNIGKPETIKIIVPSKIKNGDKLALRDVEIETKSGKKVKKDIIFKVEIKD